MILRLLLLAAIGAAMFMCISGNYGAHLAEIEAMWAQLRAELERQVVTPEPGDVPDVRYVATGDSVAAGADLDGGRRDAYPALLAARMSADLGEAVSVTDVSCPGATTAEYVQETQCGFSSPQVAALEPGSTVTTITIGANDFIGWITSNRRCILDERVADLLRKRREDCDLYARVVVPLEENLDAILARATASSDYVVVTQYYNIFAPSFAPSVAKLPYEWTSGVNDAIDLLNESIARVASTYGEQVVVVDLRPAFATHMWGDSDSYVTRLDDCSLIDVNTPWSSCWWVPGIHPNERGQQVIAAEIWFHLSRRLAGS